MQTRSTDVAGVVSLCNRVPFFPPGRTAEAPSNKPKQSWWPSTQELDSGQSMAIGQNFPELREGPLTSFLSARARGYFLTMSPEVSSTKKHRRGLSGSDVRRRGVSRTGSGYAVIVTDADGANSFPLLFQAKARTRNPARARTFQ